MKTSMIIPKVLFTLIAFAFVFMPGQAQVHVAIDGDVGIGTTSPSARLDVILNGTAPYSIRATNSSTTGTKYGVYNYVTSTSTGSKYGILNYTYNNDATNTASAYGLYNYTLGSTGHTRGQYNYTNQLTGSNSTGYGLYNYLYTPTTSTGYGIYNYTYTPSGNATNRYGLYNATYNYGTGSTYALYSTVIGSGGTTYAGYFNGDVHVQGNLTWTSDERTKENVRDLQSALALVNRLQPKTYTFIADEDMNLPEGDQYGFVAQELEAVLPALVKTVEHPGAPESVAIDGKEAADNMENPTDIPTGESKELKAVNYVAMIPILVQAIKEQQQEIEALKQQLNDK